LVAQKVSKYQRKHSTKQHGDINAGIAAGSGMAVKRPCMSMAASKNIIVANNGEASRKNGGVSNHRSA